MRRSVSAAASRVSALFEGCASIGRGAGGAFGAVITGRVGLAVTIRSAGSTTSAPEDRLAGGSLTGTGAGRFFSANGTPAAMTMPPAIAAIHARDDGSGAWLARRFT